MNENLPPAARPHLRNPRSLFPLEEAVAVELLADLVIDDKAVGKCFRLRGDARTWGGDLIGRLGERGAVLCQRPKIVRIGPGQTVARYTPPKPSPRRPGGVEDRKLREAVQTGWHLTYQQRRNAVAAFAAAAHVAMNERPLWTLGDAIDYVVEFILPDSMHRTMS